MSVIRLFSTCLLSLALPLAAQAKDQIWPQRPVTIVVPFPAGGATDVMARLFAPEISQAIGTPVIVENRAGAGGTVGTQYVARAENDGYTLLWGTVATHGIGPNIYKRLNYHAQNSFIPIIHAVDQPYVFVAHPSAQLQNTQDLIKAAKANPGAIAAASAGVGTGAHMILEKFQVDSDTELLLVPYKGAGPAMVDVIGGQVSITADVILTTAPHINGGKLIALAVTSRERSATLPDVPTMDEAGLEGFVAVGWNGLFGLPGTDPSIVEKINEAVNQALENPAIRERLIREGSIPVGGSPEEFGQFISSELASWKTIAEQANVSLD